MTTYTPGKPLGGRVCVHTRAGVGDSAALPRCRQPLSPEGCGPVRASTGGVPPSQSDPSLRAKDTSDQARETHRVQHGKRSGAVVASQTKRVASLTHTAASFLAAS